VVASSPEDIDLIKRSPGYRRTFMDMALSQMSRAYLVTLQQYAKALAHRNVLVRRRQEGRASRSEMDVWDQAIVNLGESIVRARIRFLADMEREVEENFSAISGEPTAIDLIYEPRGYALDDRSVGDRSREEQSHEGQSVQGLRAGEQSGEGAPAGAGARVREGLMQALESTRQMEIVRGFTLFGPHLDDFKFLCAGRDLRVFGSEGEQRSAVLALTCAEVSLIREKAGYYPIVLLDDVFAELDEARSRALTALISGFDQIVLTSSRPTPPAEGGIKQVLVADGRIAYA
jgi:DNA replication and repair protein RecF